MAELICIVCPKGCHLTVDESRDYAVSGHSCPRGEAYGKAELTHPTRTVTSTVRLAHGAHPRCPVKTDRPVPKALVPEVMRALDGVTLTAPVRIGQVVIEHICGTDANVVATRDLNA